MTGLVGAALAGLGLLGLVRGHRAATAFPDGDPVREVDEALVRRLRERPGLHVPLAPDYALAPGLALDLVDDPTNRRVYRTDVDLRERSRRRSVHIQVKRGRGAIHVDGWNPRSGLLPLILHGTLEERVVPYLIAAIVGGVLVLG